MGKMKLFWIIWSNKIKIFQKSKFFMLRNEKIHNYDIFHITAK